jgi:predicted RNA-binding protein with RPS1 domain
MNYEALMKLNNEMSVYDSYSDSVKQFISRVQNFEQNKILKSDEDNLHDMQIRTKGDPRRRRRRRKKKRKTVSDRSVMKHPISSLILSSGKQNLKTF